MNSYIAATAISLAFTPQDDSGNPLDLSTVSYEIRDGEGAVLVPLTPVANYAPNTDIELVVDASLNQLAQGAAKDIRVIAFEGLDTQGNTVKFELAYFIVGGDGLSVGVNTFMSFALAELVASDMPGLSGWSGASKQEKIAALIEARLRIVRLRFNLGNHVWGQDSLNFIPEGSRVVNYVGEEAFVFRGDLSLMSAEDFANLPIQFKQALYRAQIAEANNILDVGNDISVRREEGLMAETIGETRQQFRPGKPLALPVCRRALSYLSTYVVLNFRVGRA